MIGRAGRNGDPARAHLFYSTRQLKKVSDQAVIDLCVSNENCRRLCILNGIGGIKEQENEKCCDTCTCGIVPYPKLDILKPKPIQRKKRLLPVRIINDDLKSALLMSVLKLVMKTLATECLGSILCALILQSTKYQKKLKS